jgi:signal transduction histidine kinase
MRLNSLATRLFATAAIWTALILPLAGLLIYSIYQREGREDFDSRIKTFLYIVLADSTATGGIDITRPTNVGDPLFEITNSGWYWQIAPVREGSDRPTLVSGSLATERLAPVFGRSVKPDLEGIRWKNDVAPNGRPIRVAELIYQPNADGSGTRFAFSVAGPLDWVYAREASFRTTLIAALAFAGIALLGVTYLQVRFGLAPLVRIERGLNEIRTGRAAKLEGDLPSEIVPLQTELNALIDSNKSIIDRARTQVGNLAHALKTPLAVITNEARESDGGVGDKVVEQAEIMRRQISHYLDRARVAARVDVVGSVTEVGTTVEALQRALERINRDKGVRIDVSVPERAVFHGEKQDLEELVGNLLDNACKWSRSAVRVTVKGDPKPGNFNLVIEDDGPGLTEEQMQQIVTRGFRLDESKPGSGLGLSIVSDLANLYHGAFTLTRSDLGGLAAQLRLPGKVG